MRCTRSALRAVLLTAFTAYAGMTYADDASLSETQKQAAAGDANAEVSWGRHLLDSKDQGIRASSTEWFRKAAVQGNHQGEWMLGSAYMAGLGVPNDTHTGLDWMRKSLVDGTPDNMAAYGLTLMVMGGFGGQSNDGLDWLKRSIAAGSTKGMLGLGMLQLSGGLGVTKDRAAGGQSIRKAAELGSAEAEAALGHLYLSDMFGSPDIPQAVHWLDAAAAQGRADAESTLGYFLISGDRGVPQDPIRGVQLAEKAIAQHEAAGYYALGTAYLTGNGKNKDAAEAWYNFAVAAKLDTKHQLSKAADRMSDAATQLKRGEIDELRARVEKIPLPTNAG